VVSIWEGRREIIQQGVDDGLTDEKIGTLLGGLSGASVCRGRKILGIKTRWKRSKKSVAEVFHKPAEAAPAELETYIDESGLTVTRCPTRYADGAGMQAVTARPRRK
jgi:hypothetical protein